MKLRGEKETDGLQEVTLMAGGGSRDPHGWYILENGLGVSASSGTQDMGCPTALMPTASAS